MINTICNTKKIGAPERKKLSNKFSLVVETLVLGKKYLYSVLNKRIKMFNFVPLVAQFIK